MKFSAVKGKVLPEEIFRFQAEDFLRGLLEAGFQGHSAVIRKELLPREGPVLDCGCGTGLFSSFFSPQDYTGVDLSVACVRAAGRRFPERSFHAMDARSLEFKPASFKRCFVAGVFHHLDLPDSRQVLSELHRVLTDDGLLVVWEDVPARQAWNLLGRAAHFLDRGRYIRPAEEYRKTLEMFFRIDKEYAMRSGVMDYAVFCCRKAL